MTSSTVAWRSIYPGSSGQYNSYLSAASGANSNFQATAGAPSYIDYEISGTHVSACGANSTTKDTVRITVYPALTVQLTPNPAILPGGGAATLHATVAGGKGPYTYQWYSGSTLLSETTSSLSVSTAGNYTVVVCDALCATMGSVSATISVSQSGCVLPINLSISAITSSTAKVSWDPIDGVYGYKIRKRPIGQTWWTNTGSYAPTPFRKFVQLIENTTYEFQIQTICNSTFTDTSIWSQVYTVTTQPFCSNPDTLSLVSVNDSTATVKWTVAANANKYRVRYRRIGDEAWTNKYQLANLPLQYKIKGLQKNTNYEVQVLTDCGYESGYSAFTQSVNFTTTGGGGRLETENGISGAELLSVFPNPNNGAFGISLNVKIDAAYHLEIVNAAGSKVFEDELLPTSGTITRNITLEPNITRGIYFVRISGGDETYSSQFMLNR